MRRDVARGALGVASGIEERRERGLGSVDHVAQRIRRHAVHLHLIVYVGPVVCPVF